MPSTCHAPCPGKSTLAHKLVERYGLLHISAQTLVDAAARAPADLPGATEGKDPFKDGGRLHTKHMAALAKFVIDVGGQQGMPRCVRNCCMASLLPEPAAWASALWGLHHP